MERFNPKDASNCLQEGEVSFMITDAEALNSKAGKPMIKLTIKARDVNAKEALITYYIMEAWQIKKIFESCSMDMDLFNTGVVPAASYVNKKGKAIVKTEYSDKYDDKSVIARFIKPEGVQSATKPVATKSDAPFPDDDIPF